MSHIELLSSDTINKIAAGEVIERPASVVKELMENSVDAGAGAVTVEVKDGGLSFIRVTDNGSGIPKNEVPLAFERHATSKIRTELDLIGVSSLGFRGEALSSIASVAKVEMITRKSEDLMGTRYVIEGGKQAAIEDVGAPEGTTIIMRDLFFNTPARRKFMKTPVTEGGYISSVVEKLALSHPEVSFRLLLNGRSTLHTSGNGKVKDIIYLLYGREAAGELFEVTSMPYMAVVSEAVKSYDAVSSEAETGKGSTAEMASGEAASGKASDGMECINVSGYAAKPAFSRGNRSCEIFFVNGRYVKSPLLTKALENAYSGFLMQHRYPFAVLYLDIDPSLIDVNVHPAKREIRFRQEDMVYHLVYDAVRKSLERQELIPDVGFGLDNNKKKKPSYERLAEKPPEPFEHVRREVGKELSTIELLQQSYRAKKDDREGQAGYLDGRYDTDSFRGTVAGSGSSVFTDNMAEGTVHSGVTGKTAEVMSYEGTSYDVTSIERPSAESLSAEGTLLGRISHDSTADKTPESSAYGSEVSESSDGSVTNTRIHYADEVPSSSAEDQLLRDCAPDQYEGDEGSLKNLSDTGTYTQLSLDERLFTETSRKEYVLLGQLFGTYWLIQYRDKFMMIDQHAAHEKVLFEELMTSFSQKTISSQQLLMPIILTLNDREIQAVEKLTPQLSALGYDIRPFGGKEYAVYGIPYNLYSIAEEKLLREMIDSLSEEDATETGDLLYERIASMSCKAAVKGNTVMSRQEADELIDRLLKLDHPYTCPHGRPTMIVMSKNEIEKKFKRIVN